MSSSFIGNKSRQSGFGKEQAPVLQGSALAEAHGATFNWPPLLKNPSEGKGEAFVSNSNSQRPSFAFDLLQYNAKTYTWV